MNKLEQWYRDNKLVINSLGVTVLFVAGAVLTYKFVGTLIDISERNTMEVVENNLKLLKDGEFFDIIVNHRSDDFTKTVVSRRWTKQDGIPLYLGKVYNVTDLTENERMVKQLNKISESIREATNKIASKSKSI